MFKPNKTSAFFVLAFLLFGLASAEAASSFYVSPSGDDNSPGTEAAPLRTITKAISLAQNPADTIYVMPGEYAETFTNPFPDAANARNDWDSAITIRAYDNGSRPVIKPAGGSSIFVFSQAAQKFIILEGLVLDATGMTGANVSLDLGANHIRIKDCELSNNAVGSGVVTKGNANYNEFLNLEIHDFAGTSSATSGINFKSSYNLVEGCHIYNVSFQGVYMYGSGINYNTIRNNVIHHITNASKAIGILLGSGTGNVAYNNVIYNSEEYGIRDAYNGVGTKIFNNTIYNCDRGIAVESSNASTTEVRNNILYLNDRNLSVNSSTNPANVSNNLVGVDPKFYDVELANFRIKLDSPAINAGATIDLVATDIDGTSRPIGDAYDIGAYEMSLVVDITPPAVPQGVAVNAVNDGSLQVTWVANTEDDLAGYKVYVNGQALTQTKRFATSHTVAGLINGVAYDVAITAVDYFANESEFSATINVTALDTTAPDAPEGLATLVGNQGVELSWFANTEVDVAGHNIYVDGIKNNADVVQGLAYTVLNLTNDQSYDFAVSAVDTSGNESGAAAIAAAPKAGTVYYVSVADGDDANPGTEEAPFKSIEEAVKVLKPGDTLLVKEGEYPDDLDRKMTGGISWDSPITIRAYPGHQPVIKSAEGTEMVAQFSGSNNKYIVLDGLTLDGTFAKYDVVKITNSANHIRFQNCTIRNSNKQGVLITGSGSDYNEFVNCVITNNGGRIQFDHGLYISTSYNLVENCLIYDNKAYGVHIYDESTYQGANYNVVRNNLCYGNPKSGIILSSGTANAAYNNVCYNNGENGIWLNYQAVDSKVINNTCYGNTNDAGKTSYGIALGSNAFNTLVQNNIFYGNLTAPVLDNGQGTDFVTNLVDLDPKFVDAANGDFRLTITSPAIDAGSVAAGVSTDILGVERPQGVAYDVGAFEFAELSELRSMVEQFVAAGELRGALVDQLTDSLSDAEYHFDHDRKDQAAKFIGDFIKHLNNKGLAGLVTESAKAALNQAAEDLI